MSLISHSLAQNPVQHTVSAGTISAGAAEKLLNAQPATGTWDYIISICADLGIVAALFLTCFLIYRAYIGNRIDKQALLKLELENAELDRRRQ